MCTVIAQKKIIDLQKRFVLLTIIFLHFQQPTVPSLPQEGSGIRVFSTVTAHIDFDLRGSDCATKLCRIQMMIIFYYLFQIYYKSLLEKDNATEIL